jgi:hypothetical protein
MWSKALKSFVTFGAIFTTSFVNKSDAKLVEFNHAISTSFGSPITFMADGSEMTSNPSQEYLKRIVDQTKNSNNPLLADGSIEDMIKKIANNNNKLLLSQEDHVNQDLPSCDVSLNEKNSGEVTVLLSISKCLNDSSIAMINDWIGSMKDESLAYFQNGEQLDVKFSTTMIPGACEARTERNEVGQEDIKTGEIALLSMEVTAKDLERIKMFEAHGRVLQTAPTQQEDIPIAVISFVNEDTSYQEILQYERTYRIQNNFNFQLKCSNGEFCGGKFQNCVFLSEDVDLWMYNPFTVTRAFHCATSLPGGVPVSYVDDDSLRQCYCACPAGFAQVTDEFGFLKCERRSPDECPCAWFNDVSYEIKLETKVDVCHFDKISSVYKIPAPFPTSNYVSDLRVNEKDNDILKLGPHISLNTYFLQGDTSTSAIYPWTNYQTQAKQYTDALTFSSFGVYALGLIAKDYEHTAECNGCLRINDYYRPHHTTICPSRLCENTTSIASCDGYTEGNAEMTVENLAKANAIVEQFYKFQKEAINDACSISNRCDLEEFSLKDFFSVTYDPNNYKSGTTCFDPKIATLSLFNKAKAKHTPFGTDALLQKTIPVAKNTCTRCCNFHVELKENWINYQCGGITPEPICEGLNTETCSLSQCVTVNGDTLATAETTINPILVKESEKVLGNLVQKGLQTYTQIHRSLECTKFGADENVEGKCTWTVKMKDIIQYRASLRSQYSIGYDAESYVYWRYRVEGDDGGWRLFEGNFDHVFNKAETKITIEAWTACGIVRKFFYYVHLHLHSEVRTCDKFDDMWYQTTVSRLPIMDVLCNYPKSDFGEITFDYHPNIGLQYARNKIQMNITQVKCSLNFQDRQPVVIVNVERENPEIVKRFAIELRNIGATTQCTHFHVACAFTYTKFGGNKTTQICQKDFTIKNCDAPLIDPLFGECQFETCAGNQQPGPYEACGGNVIKETEKITYMATNDVTCCKECGLEPKCTSILGLPLGQQDIKRCIPPSRNDYDGTGIDFDSISLMLEGVKNEDSGDNETMNMSIQKPSEKEDDPSSLSFMNSYHGTKDMALLGFALAGTVLMVVGILTIRRREAFQTAEEGYYHPLLENAAQ